MERISNLPSASLCTLLFFTLNFIDLSDTTNSNAATWWNQNPSMENVYGYRTSYPSPTGGIIYRNNRPEGRRQSRNPNRNFNGQHNQQLLDGNQNRILVGEICDPDDPVYNKCTLYAHCIPSENNLHRCNCTEGYDPTSDKRCRLSWGQYCTNKDSCNWEAGLVCIDNRCECENSENYQFAGKSCRSKVGGSCTPPSTEVGVRFSKVSNSCVKNAQCKSFGPNGLSFRCICKPGYIETRFGYCAAGVGMQCHGKGDCDTNIPLVCKQGICACRDSLHVYDPDTNTCVGLSGAQCCTDPEGLRCISAVRTGCVEGSFCKETSLNLPGRCTCLPFNIETEERLCKPNPNL